MNDFDKVYDDNEAGAIACLKSQTDGVDFTESRAIPDPEVQGVWKVMLPAEQEDGFAIVFMKGHPDPWGKSREENDFETNLE